MALLVMYVLLTNSEATHVVQAAPPNAQRASSTPQEARDSSWSADADLDSCHCLSLPLDHDRVGTVNL